MAWRSDRHGGRRVFVADPGAGFPLILACLELGGDGPADAGSSGDQAAVGDVAEELAGGDPPAGLGLEGGGGLGADAAGGHQGIGAALDGRVGQMMPHAAAAQKRVPSPGLAPGSPLPSAYTDSGTSSRGRSPVPSWSTRPERRSSTA
jgi:hypothetical protein